MFSQEIDVLYYVHSYHSLVRVSTRLSSTHTSFTFLKRKLKINSRRNRDISEGPETSVLEDSMRRIQFFQVHFASDIICRVILKKSGQQWITQKMKPKYLCRFPRLECSVRGLGFVVPFWFVREFIFRVPLLLGVQFSCSTSVLLTGIMLSP